MLLAYRASAESGAMLRRSRTACRHDVTADDGIGHMLWRVADGATPTMLTRLFDAMAALYIADGHHRSAAAARAPGARGSPGRRTAISVLFPHHEMRILDYNRVVRDLNGPARATSARTARRFAVAAPRAGATGSGGRVRDVPRGRWHRLTIRPDLVPAEPRAGLTSAC